MRTHTVIAQQTMNVKSSVIVFDVDGVLGDFEELRKARDAAHILEIAKKYSITTEQAATLFFETKERLKKQGKPSTIHAMNALEISNSEYYSIINAIPVEEKIIPTPNGNELLKELSKTHFIAALTNTPNDAIIKTLAYLNLLHYFDKIYSIDTHNYVKPDVAIFQTILKDLNVKKGWSIGDSIEKDIEPAMKAGLRTIIYGTNEKGKADCAITELLDLLRIVREEKNTKDEAESSVQKRNARIEEV